MRSHDRIIQRSISSSRLEPSLNAGPKGVSLLPPSVKNGMEAAFETDFSGVRIFQNSEKAVALNANAFAKGNEIHFAPGKYNPGTTEGNQLIGHELAHVIQQQQGRVTANQTINGIGINNNQTLEAEAHSSGTKAAKTLNGNFAGKNNSLQKKNAGVPVAPVIQKDDDEEGFSIDFDLLPPRLRMELWALALDADTSRVRLSFSEGIFSGNLSYNYGGNIGGGFNAGAFRSTFSVDPTSGNFSLGAGTSEAMFGVSPLTGGFTFSGSSHGFRYGANASIPDQSFGFNLGFGAPLLPMPWDFGSTVTAGVLGLHNIVGGMDAFMQDPLAAYDLHSDDFSAISSAVSAGRQIANQQSGMPFGASLVLNYNPELGIVIGAGAQYSW